MRQLLPRRDLKGVVVGVLVCDQIDVLAHGASVDAGRAGWTRSNTGLELAPVGYAGLRSAGRTESGRIRSVVAVDHGGHVMRERAHIGRRQSYLGGQLSLHGRVELVDVRILRVLVDTRDGGRREELRRAWRIGVREDASTRCGGGEVPRGRVDIGD